MQENPEQVLAAETPGDQESAAENRIPAATIAEPAQLPPPAAIVIPIRWTKRVRVGKSQGHLGAGIGLFALGLSGLFSPGHHLVMSLISVLVAGFYLILAARELLHIRRDLHIHSRIGWVEVFGGLVIFVESFERLKPGRIFQAASCTMLVALIPIALGLFKERIDRAFCLRVDDGGFRLRLRPFKVVSFAWDKLADLSACENGRRLEIGLKDGERRTISLRRVANREEIYQAIVARMPATDTSKQEKQVLQVL